MRKLVVVGVLLMVAGVVIASTSVTRGDTYCGQPLWDMTTGPVCDMASRRAASVALFGGGAVLAIAGARSTLVAIALVGAAVGGLVVANRLLEPIDARYCGSVVNRHTSNGTEPSLDQECDELVEPHRNQAIGAGAATIALLGLAYLADRARQPEPV